ncbi:MAG TPA: CheR family methyltransferase [Longimicrobium sp.]|nr:CheR family methyltransferase [Longimicrobium sp.]
MSTAQQSPRDPQFESLLEFLKASRSFDFTAYKRSTLMRRVARRMQAVGIQGFDAYRDYLELHAHEFDELLNTILINVTSFFRDHEAWEVLAREFVPALLARKGPGEPVRVWSAGCASGQETYTVMMVLADAMQPEEFRARVKVYATDADHDALTTARQGTYDEDDLDELPAGYRDRYFERTGGLWTFRADLRRQVIFGRHDLVQDAPISHLDLLVCRNVLMYFNAEVQSRILSRFHFALAPHGMLFLGKAEMIRSHSDLFVPANLQARVFRKTTPGAARERLLMAGRGGGRQPHLPPAQQITVREAALNAMPVAQLVVSPAGQLLLANETARRLFALAPADIGRPLQDLTVSYRPVELRSRIEQVLAERRAVHLGGVEHGGPGEEPRSFDVELCPLSPAAEELVGVSIVFIDVTRHTRLQSELEFAHQSLETAFEELQSTNEELETTNEELQSSNEELETMNEELQSTNEELETLNAELQRRTGALNDANAYLSSVLTSLRSAVLVVDGEMRVRVWSPRMEEMWGLRAGEVEQQHFLHLDFGLPLDRLKPAVRAVLEGRDAFREMELDAVNRRGRAIRCAVAVSPLLTPLREIRGAVVLMDEADAQPRPAAVRDAAD